MSKLKKILVRARRQVFSEMVGSNPSIFQGEGYDFIELREYMPCLLYTSPSPRDISGSRMPSSA